MSTSYGILTVRDPYLYSALRCFGIPIYEPDPIREIRPDNGKPFHIFNFEAGRGGEEIVKQWSDKGFIEKNPDHPLSWIIAAMRHREEALDYMHGKKDANGNAMPVTQVVHKRSGRIHFIPVNAQTRTPQEQP